MNALFFFFSLSSGTRPRGEGWYGKKQDSPLYGVVTTDRRRTVASLEEIKVEGSTNRES